jgi:predicted enzyme related to lactoylglutathione lyase
MAITATKPRTNARKTTNGFWWADLQAKDVAGAKEFYGRTLGWEFRTETDDEGRVIYETALASGVKVAGLGELQADAKASGMPSMWTCYVTVADADATCELATRLGGQVMMPAMDIMDEGRMAIIVDPTGAAFGIWQNGNHTGADAVNQPATITWTELYTSNVESSRRFYAELFGWGSEQSPEAAAAGQEYWMLTLEGRPMAGLMPKPAEMGSVPDMWLTYIGVADVEAAKLEVEAAGGAVLWGPMQTGPGRSIGVQDPQGAVLTYMQLDEWPED